MAASGNYRWLFLISCHLKGANSLLDTRNRRTSARDVKKGVALSKTAHSVINIPSHCWHAIGISWNYAVWLIWYVMSIAIKCIKWTLSLGLRRISWCYVLFPISVTVSVMSSDRCHRKLRSIFILFLWVIFFLCLYHITKVTLLKTHQ